MDAHPVTNAYFGRFIEATGYVSVTVQCAGCIVVHIEAPLQNGAMEDEIMEAISAAIQVKAGPALIYSTGALDGVKAKISQTPGDASNRTAKG
jgi:AhpD family alkylhydroperoxidase